jgi:type II secretory pathway pseudopilin PulG
MMRDNRGMTILEVAVSGAILAVILLGIANFSTFTAKMNQSNNESGNFAGIMSSIDNIIKTQACDTLLGGITVPTSVGSSLAFSGFSPSANYYVAGFVLASPSPAPTGFAFGTGTDPTSFQMTLISGNLDTATVGAATWNLETFDLRVALKKVDSSGHPMAGTPMQMKDYILNLWVSGGATVLPVGSGATQYGTCTFRNTSTSGPVITPACVTYPGNFTVNWSMPAADTPALTLSAGWGVANPALAPGQTSYTTLAAPNANLNNLSVSLVVTDPVSGTSSAAAASNAVSAYQSPTVSAIFNPSTFGSVPMPTLPMTVTTNANGVGGTVSVTNPITYALPLPGPFPSVPVNITAPATAGQTYPFTVVATNGCGATAQSIAYATYNNSCTPSCATVPPTCTSGATFSDGCGGTCSCPTSCTGCPASSTYCASAAPPVDSCGNSCGAGTEAAGTGCALPSAVCVGSPMGNDSCGNPCPGPATEACASPSPSPSCSAPGSIVTSTTVGAIAYTTQASAGGPTTTVFYCGCLPTGTQIVLNGGCSYPIPVSPSLFNCCNPITTPPATLCGSCSSPICISDVCGP